ncbi:RNA pyrophosphohydrolase [Formicincola oecophyllae]|uniref:RNA pyrophosphohydrolase n=1 Tax=Formicincola oecophyllae TaxID=2558361 RepID=A0A4Y6UCK9_9PROT|nr:RNA pyrophosphohydrolase [Formicincola oecophyllae]QDH14288.1 RNA pyrophosphohydrolase [Formicincola oecophyllae]
MTDPSTLPYRRNAGIALFNHCGELFLAKRTDLAGNVWQFPQGGIDEDETPLEAAWREMGEETGTNDAVLLGSLPEWVRYDLPANLVGQALGGRYRGQEQKWFVFGFTGQDSAINLTLQTPPEFSAWRWVKPADVLSGAYDLGFKKELYSQIIPQLVQVFEGAAHASDAEARQWAEKAKAWVAASQG